VSEQELDTHTPDAGTEPVSPAAEQAMAEAAEAVETGATPDTALVEDPDAPAVEQPAADATVSADEFVAESEPAADAERARLKAVIEAMIYITDEPLSLQQIAAATARAIDLVKGILDELVDEYERPDRGLSIRELAGGYKMATKPEHHEEIRQFVKNLKPPLKLSLAALETLAVIAYKQPITAPEIMDIRGVQGAGVLKTLLDRKLIATAGRKNVVGKPILYKTTRDFLVQFGLKDLSELPTLKEFEELGRLALTDEPSDPGEAPREEPDPERPPIEEPPPPPDQPEPPEKLEGKEPSESNG
jgi:segregation and condensation protein B